MELDYIDNLKILFKKTFNEDVVKVENIRADGSQRRIVRIFSEKRSVVGVFGPDKKENKAFIKFSKHFRSKGFNVPEIFSYDEENQIYLETDLGNTTLFDYLIANKKDWIASKELIEKYKLALYHLAKFQIYGIKGLDLNYCFPRKEFDEQSMMWDLNYFKYYFLKLGGIEFDEQKLENDYRSFVDIIRQAPREFFLYRDFQSRNIMLKDNDLYFIDYQGGRKGFLAYDVASLLFDAKAEINPNVREYLLDYYLNIEEIKSIVKREEFLKYYYYFVYIRLMQAMGAYGLRGFYEKKPHFLTSISYVVKNIEWLMENTDEIHRFKELARVFNRIVQSEYLKQFSDKKPLLNLRIYSFSYRNSIPPDEYGNNGGFVFDLRCLVNPHKVSPAYANLTGMDRAVIDFLDSNEEVDKFYKNCYALVKQAVENYISRGFNELYVAFGCTGGRHRSVYMARRLYNDFLNYNGVNPVLKHTALEKSRL